MVLSPQPGLTQDGMGAPCTKGGATLHQKTPTHGCPDTPRSPPKPQCAPSAIGDPSPCPPPPSPWIPSVPLGTPPTRTPPCLWVPFCTRTPPPSPRVWGDTPPTPAGLGSGGADHAPLPKTTPTAGRCSRSSRGERPLGGAFSRCRSVPHSFVPPASFPGGAEASGTVRGGRRRFGGNWVGTAGENRVPGLGGLGGGGSGEVEVAGPGVLGV